MSANYDKNQRFSFVYSNLYQIYKKGKEAAKASEPNYHLLKTGGVIREQNLGRKPEIREYKPMELMGKRIKRSVPELAQATESRRHTAPTESFADPTLKSLRDNLNSLNELHSRLRFMLKELEDLVQD